LVAGVSQPYRPNSDDVRVAAVYHRQRLDKDTPERQKQVLDYLLNKVIVSNASEVGSSRQEVADHTGMPVDSARRAMDYIAKRAEHFTRSDTPKMTVNQHAAQRQRRNGYRPRYWYRLKDVDVPPETESAIREHMPLIVEQAQRAFGGSTKIQVAPQLAPAGVPIDVPEDAPEDAPADAPIQTR
jgi:hypothetical protein